MRPVLRKAKSMKNLERILTDNGWHCSGKNHRMWKCGCGAHMITLPSTPKGKGHVIKNYQKHVDRNWCVT